MPGSDESSHIPEAVLVFSFILRYGGELSEVLARKVTLMSGDFGGHEGIKLLMLCIIRYHSNHGFWGAEPFISMCLLYKRNGVI